MAVGPNILDTPSNLWDTFNNSNVLTPYIRVAAPGVGGLVRTNGNGSNAIWALMKSGLNRRGDDQAHFIGTEPHSAAFQLVSFAGAAGGPLIATSLVGGPYGPQFYYACIGRPTTAQWEFRLQRDTFSVVDNSPQSLIARQVFTGQFPGFGSTITLARNGPFVQATCPGFNTLTSTSETRLSKGYCGFALQEGLNTINPDGTHWMFGDNFVSQGYTEADMNLRGLNGSGPYAARPLGSTTHCEVDYTGVVGTLQTKWWISADGGQNWLMMKDWSTDTFFDFTPYAPNWGPAAYIVYCSGKDDAGPVDGQFTVQYTA